MYLYIHIYPDRFCIVRILTTSKISLLRRSYSDLGDPVLNTGAWCLHQVLDGSISLSALQTENRDRGYVPRRTLRRQLPVHIEPEL